MAFFRNKTEKKKGGLKKKLLIAALVIFILFMIGGASAAVYIWTQVQNAPDISSVDISPEGYLSVIEDDSGNKIDSLYMTESNRIYVKLEDTPEYLQNAFVAIEDSRFYSHHGIDVKGIIRAAVKGVLNGFHFSEGASTITQQLLKNNVFDGWTSETTFTSRLNRKIQEQYLALQVEKKYSKEWILENYMNTINLGGGTRGVQVAARYYFGKDVSQLSLAESALIAGITKNPSAYDPKSNPEKSLERQKLVLNAMCEQGYITEEEKEAALSEDVIGHLVTDSSQYTKVFSWYEDALLTSVVSDLMEQKGYTEEEAWNLIYTGGLTIKSTLNANLQSICETAVNDPAFIRDTEQVSVVITDVHTGAVAAIVGGRGEKTSSLIYNRATDSVCQPGSAIKMIGEYAAALDLGLTTLGSSYADEPYTYSDGTEIHNSYESYLGMTTLDQAIACSCNIVALKMYQAVEENAGAGKTFEYLEKFGITTLDDNDKQEALAIGGTYNGVTNLELTGAYNAIADDGQYIRPYFYTTVTDQEGKVILENKTDKTAVISENTADLLTIGMEEVMKTGTGTTAAVDGLELAGKSGTSNEYRDSWFVGFSSEYTCGIWGGHDDHSPQTDTSYVKDMWKSIMQQAAAADQETVSEPLVDDSRFTQCKICTKCGKLAIDGLCDSTVQGDVTTLVYYVPGTEPIENCTCHVKVERCSESKMRSSKYCPSSTKYSEVFLATSIPGTADEGYSVDVVSDETCTVHQSLWDSFFKKKTEEAEKEKEEEEKKKSSSKKKSTTQNSTDDTSEKSITDYLKEYFSEYFGE